MKRTPLILLIALALLISFTGVVFGEESEVESENAVAAEQESRESAVSFENLNEMQMAMTIINKQIDYLKQQIRDKDRHIEELKEENKEQLDAAGDRYESQIEFLEEKLEEAEGKLEAKESELVAMQDEYNDLLHKNAIFISESGLYLKILIGFIAGTLFGLIVGLMLNWWKRKGTTSGQASI
ncbi:uncharacterized protein HemX [Desulfitispora alkaliphila]|uniref:hypothetical protein n=1 Tax=Desulfitispora alkaliphila TaxID=622674 RepID=UPI003D20C93E